MPIRTREIKPGIKGREEWLGWRKENINASEAGALLGVDRFRTPLALYHEKFGDILTEETEAMRRGRWLEPAVIKAGQETHPDWEIIPFNFYFDDPDLRVGCTPDAIINDQKSGRRGVFQAKTVNEETFKGWLEGGEPKAPLSYEVQTVIEAMQTQRMDFAVLGLLVVGYRVSYMSLPVPVHFGAWEAFLKRAKAFWADAEKGLAPAATPPDGDLIKKIYPVDDGTTIDLSGDNELAALMNVQSACGEMIRAANAKMKPIVTKRDEIRNLIRARMGAASIAILPGGFKATCKVVERRASAARTLFIRPLKEGEYDVGE